MSGQIETVEFESDMIGGGQIVRVGPKFMLDPYCLMQAKGTKPTIEEFGTAVKTLSEANFSIQFWIGDMVNLGESLYGEEAAQHIDHERFSEETVRSCAFVAKKVAPNERQYAQSFSHCQVVATLKPAEQRKWLEKSRQEGWSVGKLRTEILKATEGGEAQLRFMLLVDCTTEAKQNSLEKDLTNEGYRCIKKSGVKRKKKVEKARKPKGEKKPKKEKKGPVTAKKRRVTKMSARRRPPK